MQIRPLEQLDGGLRFDVLTHDAHRAIRDGYIEFRTTQGTRHQAVGTTVR